MQKTTNEKWKSLVESPVVCSVLSILLSLLIASVFILAVGKSPVLAFSSLLKGSLGSVKAVANTLNKSVPLIITGLAAGFAFKSGLLNIGIEGQLHIGALFSILTAMNLPAGTPAVIAILMCIIAGMLGGMIWGALIGLLKVKCGINEVIIAILLNYIAIEFVSYMINYPLQSAARLPETDQIPAQFRFPSLVERTQLSASLFLALAAVIVVYIIINKTTLGYKLRAVGDNASAAKAGGIAVTGLSVLAMAMSGAIGGLAGTTELLGTYGKLFDGFSGNCGFTGLAVAVLANNNPFVIILTGLLFGIMDSGARMMSIRAGLSANMVVVIQGLVIFFVATPGIFNFIKKKRRSK
ncbi:ABC transporter permease [Hydrogenoanaerobacterium sp.]|uniref:ABC transporter permease n=1 Tax=Hydrogenoanaerobacterium sp. TaxID=2953763 RepID=UPI0028988800|nr:ABC transporter permease [Hydrogenoanaerobacterium sp.]